MKNEFRELRLEVWRKFLDRKIWGEHHKPEECGECPLEDDDDDVAMIPE